MPGFQRSALSGGKPDLFTHQGMPGNRIYFKGRYPCVSPVEIEAEADCDVLLIPAPVFSALAVDNIYVENYAYKIATERFSSVVEALQQMLFLSLTQRIAAFLIDESAQRKDDSIRMTHEEIAKAIGSAREAVSRTLKQMVKKGDISLFRGGIKIENKSSLYELLP